MSTEAPTDQTLADKLMSLAIWLYHSDQVAPIVKDAGAETCRLAAERLSALATRAQVPAEPPGWKLVPIEPTLEMLVSGQEAWWTTHVTRPALEDCEQATAVYRAMLATIPDSSVDPVLIRGDTKGSSDHGASAPSGAVRQRGGA